MFRAICTIIFVAVMIVAGCSIKQQFERVLTQHVALIVHADQE